MIQSAREKPRRKRPELFTPKIDSRINPDTGKPFRDRRSKVLASGRVICRGADMKDLRERVGRREAEICQHCEEWAELYPTSSAVFAGEMHHIFGRGMGGGKRNDVAAEQEWLCGGPSGCHAHAKIKRRSYSGIVEPEEREA